MYITSLFSSYYNIYPLCDILKQGKLKIGKTKAWIGGFGEVCPFGLVSDGKALLAQTLTGKGITTAPTATFATINNNMATLVAPTYTWDIYRAIPTHTVGTVSGSGTYTGTASWYYTSSEGDWYWELRSGPVGTNHGAGSSYNISFSAIDDETGTLMLGYYDSYVYRASLENYGLHIYAPSMPTYGSSQNSIQRDADGNPTQHGAAYLMKVTSISCPRPSGGGSSGSTATTQYTLYYSERYMTTSTTWSCGTTALRITQSKNANAYPINGRAGQYWYIRRALV